MNRFKVLRKLLIISLVALSHAAIAQVGYEGVFDTSDLEILSNTCPREYPTPQGTLSFDITIRNNGTVPSEPQMVGLYQLGNSRPGLQIRAKYGDAAIGSIPAGQTRTFSVHFDIPLDYIWPLGVYTVHSNILSLNGGETFDYEIDLFCQKNESDIAVTITTEDATYADDGLCSYTVTVTNNGSEDVYNLRTPYAHGDILANGFPEVMTFTPPNSSFDGGFNNPFSWNIPMLAVGEQATLEVNFSVPFIEQLNAPHDEVHVYANLSSPHLIDSNTENNGTGLVFKRRGAIQETIDLELSIGTDTPDIAQWQRGTFTLTLENKGEIDVSGAVVEMLLPNSEVARVGSSQPIASSGQYSEPRWTNIAVPAGGSATLQIDLFSKVPDLSLFAQVISYGEFTDIDSSPNNGICCTANEDDEATFPNDNNSGGGEDFDIANLEILGNTCPTQHPQPNGTLSFNVTVRNNANVASPPQNLSLFRIINFDRGAFTSEKYDAASIPAIPAGATRQFTVTYNIPFEQILTRGTILGFEISVGTEVLTFLDTPSFTERGYPIDIFCQEDNSNVSLVVETNTPTYGADGKISYSLLVHNEGQTDVHNLRLIYARTGPRAGFVNNVDYPANTSIYNTNIGAFFLESPQYWFIPELKPGEMVRMHVDFTIAATEAADTRLPSFTVATNLESPHLVNSEIKAAQTFTLAGNPLGLIDLELSLSTDTPDIAQWQRGTYTLTLENKGETDATGVSVSLPLPSNEVTLVGGTRPRTTVGTYTQPTWSNINIPAGGIATLTLDLFSKVPNLNLFAEVMTADQEDLDSTPNNSVCCIPMEDDETTLLSDLILSNVMFPSQVERGEDIRFDFDVDNIGYATAAGDFSVGFYISEDEDLNDNDRFIGFIRTGDLTVGKHEARTVANVAKDVMPGEYYLIAVVDVDGQVVELNEENNKYTQRITVGQVGDVDLELAFSSSSEAVAAFVPLPLTLTITNTGDGDATGVVVYFPLEQGKVVLEGGNTPVFSQGNYNYFNGMWYVNDLPAGASATLDIRLFPLAADYVPFAQVIAMNQDDIDSTPNNGTCCTPNEDDEVAFTGGDSGGGNADKIDIELSISTPKPNVGKFKQVPLTVAIENKGNRAATDVIVSLYACGLADVGIFFGANGIVYANSNANTSLGGYNLLEQLWLIPRLNAGQSATLDFTLYTLTDEPISVGATTINYLEDDIDSSDDIGGSNCEVLEDDEAVLDINTGTFLPNPALQLRGNSSTSTLRAYPNPVSDALMVQFQNTGEVVNYTVYDVQGKLYASDTWSATNGFQNERLDVTDLPSGIYILQLNQENQQQSIRFVKE